MVKTIKRFSRTFGCGCFSSLSLANSTKICYTYDNLSRVTARTVKNLSDDSIVSSETFSYDAAGTSNVIFGYNGRDGVVTDDNGLIYMRSRYYSPKMRRFVNADVIVGKISDSGSLNRYAYVNGNPVSFADPFGLSKGWGNWLKIGIGVAVIATLAVVATVATAGTATAVIASAALTGSIIGGAVGATTGYIENGIDGATTGFMTGVLAGGASGAVGASTFGSFGVAASNTAIDVGEYIIKQYANGTDDDITIGSVFLEAGKSLLFGNIEIKLKKGIHIDFGSDPGWLNKKGDLGDDYDLLKRIIKDEADRTNRDYAEKKLLQSHKRFEDVLFERLWEYGIDVTKDGLDDIFKTAIEEFYNGYIEDEKYICQRK